MTQQRAAIGEGTVMQTNDVQIVRVFTTAAGGWAQDNTPNEVAGTRQTSFDLVVDGEAGDASETRT